MNTLTLEQEFQKEVPALVTAAQSFVVTNDEQYHEAVELANVCKNKLQTVIDWFAPMKKTAHDAWKQIVAKENEFAPQLEQAKKLYTQKAADYQLKKQREQEAKEREAREAADRAEAKRKKDIQDKIDEENRKAEEARKAGDAEALAKIETNKEKLEAKQEAVQVAPRPVAQAPRSAAMSVQTVWEPEIIDEALVPRMFWKEIDMAKLKRMKKDDPKLQVPGVRFTEKAQGAAIGRK